MESDNDEVEPGNPDDGSQSEATAQAMREQGVASETAVYDDYFGFASERTVMLPDGKQWVSIKTLTEGDRRKYLNAVNKDVTIDRASGNAKMKVASGDDRHILLEAAITGWSLFRPNEKTGNVEPVPYNDANLRRFLSAANPKLIDLIEKEIRKDNEWLTAEVTIEDIDKSIEELNELRARKVAEAEGKES